MKKISIILCVFMLCIIFITPTFANNIDDNNQIIIDGVVYNAQALSYENGNIMTFDEFQQQGIMAVICKYAQDVPKLLIFADYELMANSGIKANMTEMRYNSDNGYWEFYQHHEVKVPLTFESIVWSSIDIADVNGDIVVTGDDRYKYCNGTTCPATDANFDNVCDDCGKPLTMSLRNTLYDYALWLAESKVAEGYNYYAIFKSSDTYYVHIAKSPMSSPEGTSLEGDGIMYNRVTQSADGTNGGSGWYNGFYNSYDEFVEANHSISNFKGALPLALQILGVAGEQITLKLPNLVGTLMILMACGVGCLALFVVLKLFGKRSLISRK